MSVRGGKIERKGILKVSRQKKLRTKTPTEVGGGKRSKEKELVR